MCTHLRVVLLGVVHPRRNEIHQPAKGIVPKEALRKSKPPISPKLPSPTPDFSSRAGRGGDQDQPTSETAAILPCNTSQRCPFFGSKL